MTDHPTQPSPANPEVDATEIIAETLKELVTLTETLPVAAKDAERTAKVLDRLSEDLAEAATLVRRAAARATRFLP
jgi:hypothetical protein